MSTAAAGAHDNCTLSTKKSRICRIEQSRNVRNLVDPNKSQCICSDDAWIGCGNRSKVMLKSVEQSVLIER